MIQVRTTFFLLFLLIGPISRAMDSDSTHDNSAEIWSSVDIEDSSLDHILELVEAINIYKNNLQQSLGCACSKSLKEFFNTAHHKHIQTRLKQLEQFKEILEASAPQELANKLFVILQSLNCKGQSGQQFIKTCSAILPKVEALSSGKEEENHHCLICLEQKKSMACLPCGHVTMCKSCFFKNMDSFNTCIVCRQQATSMALISDLCRACNEIPPDYIGECGHSSFCKDCLQSHKEDPCNQCRLVNENHGRLFY